MNVKPGKWECRDGGIATVGAVTDDPKVSWPVIGWDESGKPQLWKLDGSFLVSSTQHDFDLIRPADEPTWDALAVTTSSSRVEHGMSESRRSLLARLASAALPRTIRGWLSLTAWAALLTFMLLRCEIMFSAAWRAGHGEGPSFGATGYFWILDQDRPLIDFSQLYGGATEGPA